MTQHTRDLQHKIRPPAPTHSVAVQYVTTACLSADVDAASRVKQAVQLQIVLSASGAISFGREVVRPAASITRWISCSARVEQQQAGDEGPPKGWLDK
eukprot:2789877-Rhodomonas_salina.1